MSICSFDIFDTVLTRSALTPSEVFYVCGIRATQFGWLSISPKMFQIERVNARNRSCKFIEGGENNLDEIYDELADALEIPQETISKLKNLELEVERELLIPVPKAYQMIAEARQSHPYVLFLSDMYLPDEFLIERLKQHGFWQEGDRLYVSSHWRKSKGKGDLFLQVLQDFSLQPQDLTHIGNSWHSDVAKPRSLGINSIHFKDANPNRYEAILQKYADTTNGITSSWAAISRYTRLTEVAETNKEAIIRDVAASVAAPILTAYVIWILQRARAKQLARIYFLARDGEILLQIAQEIAPRIYPEVELRYLYVSRQALRMPGLTTINRAFWEWMFDDTTIFTIEALLARMCVERETARPILEPLGYPYEMWQRNLSTQERKVLRSRLEQHEPLHKLVLKIAEQKREVLKAYLEQEKMLDGKAFGLVDVGWRGSLQISLENVFEIFGTRMPVGFYFALDRPTGGLIHKGEVLAFFFNLNNSTGLRNDIDYRYVSAMEVFCAGCEGTTLDYALQADNSVIPVLKHVKNQPALDWGLKGFQKSVLSFVRHLVARSTAEIDFSISPKLLREALDEVFLTFNNAPTQEEAEAFRDCPFFDDPNELYHFYWAMPLPLVGVLKYAIAMQDGLNVHRNAWYEASLQVSSPLVKAIVPWARAQRRILRRVKRLVKRL